MFQIFEKTEFKNKDSKVLLKYKYTEEENIRLSLQQKELWKKHLNNAPKSYSLHRVSNPGHYFEGGTPNYVDSKREQEKENKKQDELRLKISKAFP